MKFLKSLLLSAAALVICSSSAFAKTETVDLHKVPLVKNTYAAVFAVDHLTAGSFTDTISFTPNITGNVKLDLGTLALGKYTDINFTSASLNGHALNLGSLLGGAIESASLPWTTVSGPLVLTLSGIAGPALHSGSLMLSAYAGKITVSPVPEPATYAMLFVGLAIVGAMMLRKRKAEANHIAQGALV